MTATTTVVVPCLDDAPALRVCLAHLARQSLLPTEVLVVDNAPTPDPELADLTQGHPFAVRLVHEPTRGVAAAAARGYDEAKGEILARCDADCRPGPGWLAAAEAALAADPTIEAVTGPVAFHDLRGWRSLVGHGVYRLGLGVGMHLAIARTPLWGSNLALRRSTWHRARPLVHRDDPRVHDDLDLTLALGPGARTRRVREMRVTAEARFARGGVLRDQVARAMHTCRLGWARQSAGHRWVARLSGGRLLALPDPPPDPPAGTSHLPERGAS